MDVCDGARDKQSDSNRSSPASRNFRSDIVHCEPLKENESCERHCWVSEEIADGRIALHWGWLLGHDENLNYEVKVHSVGGVCFVGVM